MHPPRAFFGARFGGIGALVLEPNLFEYSDEELIDPVVQGTRGLDELAVVRDSKLRRF